ncbi:hypothetical protein BpHYR1_029754 [Brachionus plicatilis]|uniref:Uncharacterized protein n=1 Tax=Brachionus plicatilis TaxID=10195 RepID=A0A3M7PFC7_BRAPC|nr:hypothetical protein BpHYR1_029754 [Brachionus plicatilis]
MARENLFGKLKFEIKLKRSKYKMLKRRAVPIFHSLRKIAENNFMAFVLMDKKWSYFNFQLIFIFALKFSIY